MTPDWEHLWEVGRTVRLTSGIVLYGCFLAWFLSAFATSGTRPARPAAAVYTAVLLVCLYLPYEMASAAAYLAGAAGAFLVCLAVSHDRLLMKLFVFLTFEAVRRAAATAGSCAYIVLSSYIVLPAHADPELQYKMYLVCCAVDVAVQAITGYAALRLVIRYFPDPHGTLTAGEFGLLCVPSASAIVTTQVLHDLRQILDYGKYSVQMESLAGVLVAAAIVSLVATVVMFGKIRAEQKTRTDRELLDGQLASMRDYIAQMERNDRRMAQVRHDVVNHLETIAALQERGDLGDASSYARRMYGELSSAGTAVHTGNPVSDVIISDQKQYAEQHGIRYTADVQFPNGLGIDAFDVGIILHNAGQNAIAAAMQSEDPWVHVRSRVHRRTLLIDVSNSCAKPAVINPSTGRPDTTRPGEHGLGLRNVDSVAERYGGNVQITAGQDTFTISVLLIVPPHS